MNYVPGSIVRAYHDFKCEHICFALDFGYKVNVI